MSAKNKTEQRLSFLKLSPYQTKKRKQNKTKKGEAEKDTRKEGRNIYLMCSGEFLRERVLSGVEFSFMAQDKIHDYCSFCQNYNIKWNVLKPDEEWGGQRGLVS